MYLLIHELLGSRATAAIGSPLLSYPDIRPCGFLPRGLLLGEARRLGPQQIREGSLLLVRDGFADQVFHCCVKHIPLEELVGADQVEHIPSKSRLGHIRLRD